MGGGGGYKEDKKPYRGTVLAYYGGRSDGGTFFPVKLVFDKYNDVDYLLLWEKVVEYANNNASTNKKYILSGNFVTAGGWGKRTCTTAAPSTLFGGGGKRTITRSVTSTLSRERNKKFRSYGGFGTRSQKFGGRTLCPGGIGQTERFCRSLCRS